MPLWPKCQSGSISLRSSFLCMKQLHVFVTAKSILATAITSHSSKGRVVPSLSSDRHNWMTFHLSSNKITVFFLSRLTEVCTVYQHYVWMPESSAVLAWQLRQRMKNGKLYISGRTFFFIILHWKKPYGSITNQTKDNIYASISIVRII